MRGSLTSVSAFSNWAAESTNCVPWNSMIPARLRLWPSILSQPNAVNVAIAARQMTAVRVALSAVRLMERGTIHMWVGGINRLAPGLLRSASVEHCDEVTLADGVLGRF